MNNFVELTFDEMLCVDGGKINSATIAGACGAVVGAGVTVISAPVVAAGVGVFALVSWTAGVTSSVEAFTK